MEAIAAQVLISRLADWGVDTVFGLPGDGINGIMEGFASQRRFLRGPVRDDRAEIEQVASRSRLVEFFWADPDPVPVEWVHQAGALAGWQVGSVTEARQAVDAGCDLVVAQGVEAGGHVRGTVGLLPLLADLLDAVTVPVLAAGGITTARSVAAVLAAGASGVRLGTRFLAMTESGAHPDYVAALLAADGEATTMTEAFAVGWPDAPHRVLSSALKEANAFPGNVVGQIRTTGTPILRYSSQTPGRQVEGAVKAMALYCGQGVGAVSTVLPAAQVIAELAEGAERLLRRWADHGSLERGS